MMFPPSLSNLFLPGLVSNSFASRRSPGRFGCCCNTSFDAAEADIDKMRRVDSLLSRCLPIVEEATLLDLPLLSGGFVPEPWSRRKNGRIVIAADASTVLLFLNFTSSLFFYCRWTNKSAAQQRRAMDRVSLWCNLERLVHNYQFSRPTYMNYVEQLCELPVIWFHFVKYRYLLAVGSFQLRNKSKKAKSQSFKRQLGPLVPCSSHK